MTPISENKQAALKKRMEELDINESDLTEKFIKGTGAGGQKINKTSSCVYLRHEPSGIEVKCQTTRSQAENRFHARRELCEKIAAQIEGEKTRRQQEIDKIRRQKKRRSRKSKEKMLVDKKRRAEIKKQRTNITEEDL